MQPGATVGRFEIEEPLGQGGMATVFKVRHRQLDSVYAMKLLKVAHPSMARRLMQEGRIQARLRHPNIVNVIDVVEHEGLIGLLLEFVQGGSLEESLRDGPMELADALMVFRQILAGVGAAHAAGVTHRDLKPANILLTVQDEAVVAKVTDFGIAKVLHESEPSPRTRAGVAMGTPGYMAPEQISNSAGVDHRADIFALGALLYEMLTGEAPYADDDALAAMNRTMAGRYRPLSERLPALPPEVEQTVARALSPRREERFEDCASMARALSGLAVAPAMDSPAAGPEGHDRAARIRRSFEEALSSPTLAPPPEEPPERSTRATWQEPRVTGPGQLSLVDPELEEDQPTTDTLAASPPPRSGLVRAAHPAEAPAETPTEATERERSERERRERARAAEEDSPVNSRDAADMMGELFWTMVRATAWGLMRTAKYGGIPALLVLILAWLVGSQSADQLQQIRSERDSRALAMNRSMDEGLELVPVLVESGANPTLLSSLQRNYEEAPSPEARVEAARELSSVMTQQLAQIPMPSTPEEIEQRRELEAHLARLDRDAARFAESERRYEAAEKTIGARLARITGQT